MNTTITDAGPFEKLVTVQIAEADIDKAKSTVARKLSRDLKIPGFRPGKAPRPVVEATVGADRLRSEAIEEVLPSAVTDALEELELEPAATPAVENIRDIDEGVEVDVKVTLWPVLEFAPDYRGRTVEVTSPDVTDEEVNQNVDRMRDQFAELETVGRAASTGDYVSINLSATQDGEIVEEAAAEDLLYEIGSGSFIEGIDTELTGSSAGEIVSFEGLLPDGFGDKAGQSVTYRLLVKEVKQKKLPDMTDEWVDDVTEFSTVEEMTGSLRARIRQMKLNSVNNEFRVKLLDLLADEMEIEIPAAIIDGEMESIFHSFSHRLEEQKISIADYLQITGQDQQAFIDDLNSQANRNVRTNLLLDAVVKHSEIEVEDAEYAELIGALAAQTGSETDELIARFAETNQEKELRSDILRRKALDALLEAAVAVDSEGNPIDLSPGEESVEDSGVEPSDEEPSEAVDDE
ncbi:MAG TPA: trigger factor [Acidimicrobiia bacterium]|nr:trigger factor [Acidimicrobiia bacterium]